jgi:hypothetical protein
MPSGQPLPAAWVRKTIMSDTQPILVSVGVIVHTPVSEDEVSIEKSDRVGKHLLAVIQQLAENDPTLEAVGCMSFHYLGDRYENAGRCRRCN